MRRLIVSALAAASLLPAADQMTKLERGRYLAEEVGKCHECHTPKTETGQLDKSKWMKGKVMEVAPLAPMEGWHKTSPDITPSGRLWAKWGGEAAMVRYLTTGLTPSGKPAGPPMPTYKLRQDDAEAIVEYLKSLR